MPKTFKELSDKVDELQIALDAEQQQVKDLLAQKDADAAVKDTAITNLQTVVTDLQAQVADGGTPEDREALVNKVNDIITDLGGTV